MTVAIIGSMLTGGHREAVIADAVRSADKHIDHWALIDTGTSGAALAAICPIIGEGRYTVYRYPYAEFDCATARNFGLGCAQAAGELLFPGQQLHAFQLDTDERMIWNGFDPHMELPQIDADIALVQMGTRDYPKARFVRLPRVGGYRDRVHEIYVGATTMAEIVGPETVELEKTEEQKLANCLRIREVCQKWVSEEPWYGRAWLHLANTYILTGDLDRARELFIESAKRNDVAEQKAWAMFKAAGCAFEMGDFEESIEDACDGMKYCAYFPELPFIAGVAAASLNRHFDALGWANYTIAIGSMTPLPMVQPIRTGFKQLVAWWDGGWDIRAAVLEAMGMTEMAQKARAMCELATKRGKE